MLPVRDEQDYLTAGRMLAFGWCRSFTARAAALTWAGQGPTSGPTREAVMDDVLAGGAAAALILGMGDWWHGDDSSSNDNGRALRGAPDRRGGPDDASRRGADGLPDLGPGGWGTGKTAAGRIALASAGRGATGDRGPWRGAIGGRACACTERASSGTFDLSGGHRLARERERLLIDALRLTACARAVLAGEQIRSVGAWAVLVGMVGRDHLHARLLARRPHLSPAWCRGDATEDAMRVIRGVRGRPLVIDVTNHERLLLCGLCGGEPSGDVDQWLRDHPLAGLVHGG